MWGKMDSAAALAVEKSAEVKPDRAYDHYLIKPVKALTERAEELAQRLACFGGRSQRRRDPGRARLRGESRGLEEG